MDMFHMGGDEVNLDCWNASQEIRDYLVANGQTGTEDELVQIWNLFQV
jgi:hexosaminidase